MKNLILLPLFLISLFTLHAQDTLPVFKLEIKPLNRYVDSLDRAMIKPQLGVPSGELDIQKFPDSVLVLGQRMPDLMFSEIKSSDTTAIFEFWADNFGTRGMPDNYGENWLSDYRAQLWNIYESAGKTIRRNLFAYYVNTGKDKVLALVFWTNGKTGFQFFDLKN